MIISIIQPCFVPWLGYFEQIALADVFVYLDDVQYTRKDWRNTNRLKSPQGVKRVYFPVENAPRSTQIKDIKIANRLPWQASLMNQIAAWYKRAPYFGEVFSIVERNLMIRYQKLTDFNEALNRDLLNYLKIDTPTYRSSSIPRRAEDRVGRIAEIIEHFGGVKILFDGASAKNFLHHESFSKIGVDTIFQQYCPKLYPQLWGAFEPQLSILDCLFNCGEATAQILETKHSRELLGR